MNIELMDVKKTYQKRVVTDIDRFVFKSGRVYALLGPNGSGKTTLIRILAGAEKPDSGEVRFSGSMAIPDDRIAYLPQTPYIFDLTVLENVMLGIKHEKSAKLIAAEALKAVGMEEFFNTRARNLSGGEAQRMAVARTLVLKRKLLLLDEPASATDIANARRVEDFIKAGSRERGATVVFSTHNPAQASRIADEVIFMWEGKIIESGLPEHMLNAPVRKEIDEFLRNWRI